MLALTFDDGPDDIWTPRLLDALAHAGAHATFFVLGEQVERHPAVVRRSVAAGHAVELHGHAHLRHTDHDAATVDADVRRALAALARAGVPRPTRWRVPWGRPAAFTPGLAAKHGLVLTGWDVDTHDWRGDPPEAMLAACRDGLRPGAVVLAHDGIGPGARRTGAAHTVALVGPLVEAARAAGLQARALDRDWPPVPAGNPDLPLPFGAEPDARGDAGAVAAVGERIT
jgi:peptidoglycan/xylan/chitin deacetylase (PgdA/CDA1 family)